MLAFLFAQRNNRPLTTKWHKMIFVLLASTSLMVSGQIIDLQPGDDDTAALQGAINALMPGGGTIRLTQGTLKITEAAIPEPIELQIMPGAMLEIEQKLQLDGSLQAGSRQIFSGAGQVTGRLKAAAVLPQWFGAQGDNVHDDTNALQKAAHLAQHSEGRLLRIPQGRYRFTSNIYIRCNVDCQGTLVQRHEVNHDKTHVSNFTYVPSHYVRKNFLINIANDQSPHVLNPEPFWGLKAGDFQLPVYQNVELKKKDTEEIETVSLLEGGTIRFFCTDFFSSRHNQYGDEWYDKTETSMLVSGRGDFYPELMYSYLRPAQEAAEWDENTLYKKGDYCTRNGRLYKATWPSGPGAVFTHRYKGTVNLGASEPKPGTTKYDFTFEDGVKDKVTTWREAYLHVTYQPPQAPLQINGLTIEVEIDNPNQENLRLNNGSVLSVSRSRVTLNDLKVFCNDARATLSSLVSNSACSQVTYNNAYVSGATYHGLGYNLLNSSTSIMTFNNCVSINCRDGIAGRCNKNVTIEGGFYNRIDDHYGLNYTIRNVRINAMGTYIPGYCTPEADFNAWRFSPTFAFAFGGGNIFIENCQIYNCTGVLSSRGDIADFYGSIVLQNLTIDSERAVVLLSINASPNFDYAHTVLAPDQVVLQQIFKKGAGGLVYSSNFGQIKDIATFPTYFRDVRPLGNINSTSPLLFENCQFDNASFKIENAVFRFCDFIGESKGLEDFLSPQSFNNNNQPF